MVFFFMIFVSTSGDTGGVTKLEVVEGEQECILPVSRTAGEKAVRLHPEGPRLAKLHQPRPPAAGMKEHQHPAPSHTTLPTKRKELNE